MVKGSATIEMAYIMPFILLLCLLIIYTIFYYHDKNILNGIAYEGAVLGSQYARLESADMGKIEEFMQQQAKGKVILLTQVQSSIHSSKDVVTASIHGSYKKMRLFVQQKAAVIEPEQYIRNIRKIRGGI